MKKSIRNIKLPPLKALHARDPAAIETVVKTYSRHIYRAALGQGFAEAEALDITQDTFKTFLETLPRFEGRSHIRTWIFGIFYNKVNEYRRKNSRRNHEDEWSDYRELEFQEDGHWMTSPRNPEDLAQSGQVMEIFGKCLEDLPGSHREAFYLKEVEGFSTDEICKILNITPTNLGVMLYRARNKLRECLEDKGVKRGDV